MAEEGDIEELIELVALARAGDQEAIKNVIDAIEFIATGGMITEDGTWVR